MAALAGALALVALAHPDRPAVGQAVVVRRDIEYGTANGKRLLLDAYLPAAGSDRRPAVVMFHGGGWRFGDKATWDEEAQRLAGRGWAAFSVNYRLDEPSAFPAEIDDAQAAVRWVRAHADEYRVDPSRVAALGESAGGHLTAMLATLGSGPLDEGARIRVGAAWSPPTDLTVLAGSRGDGWVGSILGCTRSTCPDLLARSSPVNHVDGTDAPAPARRMVPGEVMARAIAGVRARSGSCSSITPIWPRLASSPPHERPDGGQHGDGRGPEHDR